MKTLYLECAMGAAGDMLMAALLELHPDPEDFLRRLNGVGIPGARVTAEPAVKCGISGTHVTVTVMGEEEESEDVPMHGSIRGREHGGGGDHVHTHDHGHGGAHGHGHAGAHTLDHGHGSNHDHGHGSDQDHGHAGAHTHDHDHGSLREIGEYIARLHVSAGVRENAAAVYRLVAEAESLVHGLPAEEVHFHELGAMDALADITGVCMLMEELAPLRITASPVHVGSGHVRCAHGILPVPAPATAFLLRDIPIYGGDIRGELCTPTGAALLRHFAGEFGPMPVMRVAKTGYGMGKKDFTAANCLRAFLGETDPQVGEVAELTCNIDDMTPEALAFAAQILFAEGALDVYTVPVGMKKGRSGIQFTCMCRVGEKEKFIALIFKHTTTLGMRENVSRRYALERREQVLETEYGPVRRKISSGYGVTKEKPEYEDIAGIARSTGMSIAEVMKNIIVSACFM